MGSNEASYAALADGVLASRVNNGDDLAFDELMLRYLSTINAIARKYSAEGYEQKDFVQEGLLALLQSCRTYKSDSSASFKTYMSVVVEHRLISIIRSSNSKRVIPQSSLVKMDDLSETIEDSASNPEETLMCREQLSSVFNKLKSTLSDTEYRVLTLYAEGLSYRQIAQRLNVSEKSVDNALQRARRKIGTANLSDMS